MGVALKGFPLRADLGQGRLDQLGGERERDVDGITGTGADGADWSWPPSAAVPYVGGRQFHTDDWAPASTVRRPWVRVGRWTVLYRRCA